MRVQLHEAHQANALLQETMAANAAHWRMILRQIAPLMDHVPGLMQGREREHGAEGGVEGGEGRGVASEGREGPQNRGSADGGGDWDAREADAEGRGGDARAGRDGSAHDSREGTSELVGEASPNDGRATPEVRRGDDGRARFEMHCVSEGRHVWGGGVMRCMVVYAVFLLRSQSQGGGGDRNEDVTTSPLYGAPTRSPSAAGGRGAAQRDDGSQEVRREMERERPVEGRAQRMSERPLSSRAKQPLSCRCLRRRRQLSMVHGTWRLGEGRGMSSPPCTRRLRLPGQAWSRPEEKAMLCACNYPEPGKADSGAVVSGPDKGEPGLSETALFSPIVRVADDNTRYSRVERLYPSVQDCTALLARPHSTSHLLSLVS